jgi:hypothetical protein
MEIYIRGSSTDELISLVTCGDVGIQQAVIIPKKFYPLILEKLDQFKFSDEHKTESWSIWQATRKLQSFLGNRCSKEFLEQYLTRHPELFNEISKPGLYLDYSPTVRLAIRLYELEILPRDIEQNLSNPFLIMLLMEMTFMSLKTKSFKKSLRY